MSTDYKIGDVINFAAAYPRKCSARFRHAWNGISRTAIPIDDKKGMGIVVGIRNVFMDNYQYSPASGGFMGDDDDPPYASGDCEKVLLVTESIYQEPFIVRLCDATKHEGA